MKSESRRDLAASLAGVVRKGFGWVRSHPYDSAALVLLVFAHVALFRSFLREPMGSDDCSYFEYATGQMAGASHHRQRFAHIASIWLAQQVFGVTTLAYYAVPFAYGLGLLIAIYLLARKFMGPLPSFIAVLGVASMPDWLRELSLPLPDVPALFWFCAGLNFFLRGFAPDRERSSRVGPALTAAVCFFLAVSTKETSVLLLPALVVQLAVVPRTPQLWRDFRLMVASMVALALVEILFCWAVFKDPLYRLHAVTGGHVKTMSKMSQDASFLRQDVSWGYLATRFFDPKEYFFGNFMEKHDFLNLNYFVWFYGGLATAIVALCVLRKKTLLPLIAVVVVAATVLSLAVVSLDPLVPLVRNQPRYFMSVTALTPVLIAAAIVAIGERLRSVLPRFWYFAAAAGCAAFALLFSAHYVKASTEIPNLLRNGRHPAQDAHKAIAKAVERVPVARIVGPKYLRSGRFSWPDLKVPIQAVARGATFDAFEAHDLLLSEINAYATDTNLMSTEVGRLRTERLSWWARWDEPDLNINGPLRVFGVPWAKISETGRDAQLQVSLQFKVSSGGVQRVQVLELDRRGKKLKRRSLTVAESGEVYNVEGVTLPISRNARGGVVVEIVPKAKKMRLTITKRDIRIVEN